jgi:hypothetical protein
MLWKWQYIFITQPLSWFVFYLPLLTQNFVYPTFFSSVLPSAINNDRSLTSFKKIFERYMHFWPDNLQATLANFCGSANLRQRYNYNSLRLSMKAFWHHCNHRNLYGVKESTSSPGHFARSIQQSHWSVQKRIYSYLQYNLLKQL